MPQLDYKNAKLCNFSFAKQDLRGVSFQNADIRGANFSDAILVEADFSGAYAGLSPLYSFGLMVSSLGLVAIAGLVVGYSSAFPTLIANLLVEDGIAGKEVLISLGLLCLVGFVVILTYRGTGASLGVLAIVTVVVTTFISFAGTGNSSLTAAAVLQGIIIAMIVTGVLVTALALSIFLSIAKPKFLVFPIIVAVAIAIIGAQEGIQGTADRVSSLSSAATVILSITLIVLSIHISLRAIAGDRRYKVIQSIPVSLCTSLGTKFCGADLTDADFTQARLPYSDFRKATLKRTSWFQSRKLESSRTEGTYLEIASIRELVISKEGKGKKYKYMNLQGLNLQGANLTEASFVGADFSEANLRDANLKQAELAKARLYGTDLTNACLTGCYIQDWAISTDTLLEHVSCTHVYMRLPTDDDPEPWRKPDNRSEFFEEGDFADFVVPIIKTLDLYQQQHVDPRQMAPTFKSLDLYHHDGINAAAAVVALKQLGEENPEAQLSVVALEGRRDTKVRVQATIAGDADGAQLYSQYFEKYHQLLRLPLHEMRVVLGLLIEKDEHIGTLNNLLNTAVQQPKFYIESQGDFIMSQSKGNVNIADVHGSVSGIVAAGETQAMTGVTIGNISGVLSSVIHQLPESSNPGNLGVRELLTELQVAIETAPELSIEDKTEALEQVKTLAVAGQNPEDGALKKSAKTAMKILKGTVSSLPTAATLVEACMKLLPAIASLLSLG
jgi:uncharacterized protein YjbI with pentapeptide repeats